MAILIIYSYKGDGAFAIALIMNVGVILVIYYYLDNIITSL